MTLLMATLMCTDGDGDGDADGDDDNVMYVCALLCAAGVAEVGDGRWWCVECAKWGIIYALYYKSKVINLNHKVHFRFEMQIRQWKLEFSDQLDTKKK